jgi:hypothetical protein
MTCPHCSKRIPDKDRALRGGAAYPVAHTESRPEAGDATMSALRPETLGPRDEEMQRRGVNLYEP